MSELSPAPEDRTRGRRGRPPRHTLAEVVAAAVKIADAEGLAGVTMRAVAAKLGTGVMSLYSYVADKQALVREMVEQASADEPLPAGPSGDWRADVHAMARQQRRLVLAHPWLAEAVTTARRLGPSSLAYLDFALGALEPTGQDAARRLETAALITGFVTNVVRAELAERQPGRRGPDEIAAEAAELTELLSSGRYPRFAAAIGAAYATREHFDLDAEFGRLLDRLLDGLVAGG